MNIIEKFVVDATKRKMARNCKKEFKKAMKCKKEAFKDKASWNKFRDHSLKAVAYGMEYYKIKVTRAI